MDLSILLTNVVKKMWKWQKLAVVGKGKAREAAKYTNIKLTIALLYFVQANGIHCILIEA